MQQDDGQRNQQKWLPEPVQLSALYFIKNHSQRYQICTITSISRKRAAVILPRHEFIEGTASCYLDLLVAKAAQQVSVRGLVRISYRLLGCVVADIQFDEPLPESLFKQLIESEPLRGWHSVLQKRLDYGLPEPGLVTT